MYPILIDFHGLRVTSFGVFVLLGVLAGGQLGALHLERLGRTRDEGWNLITVAVFGGLLGAKLWYVGETLVRSTDASFVELMFSLGGLTWYGALVGGLTAFVGSALLRKIPLVDALSAVAPAVAVGQMFGRIGCFMVGDDWGRPTDLPWGIAFPNGIEPIDVPVHPTMLYEAFWLALVSGWLWLRRDRSPFLFGEYLVLAGAGRFVIEFWRRNPGLVGGLSNAQITALVFLVSGALLWVWFLTRRTPPQEALQ